MNISSDFEAIAPFVGGCIIAFSTSINLGTNGRVTGISGIMKSAIFPSVDRYWKRTFVAGLLLGSAAMVWAAPQYFAEIDKEHTNFLAVILAGLLVGVGTGLGSGCTSGHGVCGLPRFSKRSFAAVISFMVTGILTSSIIHEVPSAFNVFHSKGNPSLMSLDAFHRGSLSSQTLSVGAGLAVSAVLGMLMFNTHSQVGLMKLFAVLAAVAGVLFATPVANAYFVEAIAAVAAVILLYSIGRTYSTKQGRASSKAVNDHESARGVLGVGLSGFLFAVGLVVSGMAQPSKVTGFLNMAAAFDPASAGWDPSLALVMGGAVGFNLPVWQYLLSQKAKGSEPVACKTWSVPSRSDITTELVIGSGIFGVGWGLAGVCPGPGLVGLATGDMGFALWCLALAAGMKLHSMFFAGH